MLQCPCAADVHAAHISIGHECNQVPTDGMIMRLFAYFLAQDHDSLALACTDDLLHQVILQIGQVQHCDNHYAHRGSRRLLDQKHHACNVCDDVLLRSEHLTCEKMII